MSKYQDFQINVKLKLAALWTALMFCYIYGDFFTLCVPGRIEELMKGQTGTGSTTPTLLLLYAVLLSIPPLMIFLSVAARPKVNRIFNLLAGSIYTLVMILVVGTSISKWMVFYIYLGIIEIVITCTIVGYAWSWPKKQT
ncbi:DUF6326 family protein [Mucilaginibacter sp. CAU 1740]|uniref:DUF6326 family protein n=1 Tax=Mucilaginibacter sp. CAU 1740 TaxID=3140365 RepID=UPI00325BBB80